MNDDDQGFRLAPLQQLDMIASGLSDLYAELYEERRAGLLAELLEIRRRLADFRDDLALSLRGSSPRTKH